MTTPSSKLPNLTSKTEEFITFIEKESETPMNSGATIKR